MLRETSTDVEWMLAIVISFDPNSLTYTVEDASEDDDDDHSSFGNLSRKQFRVPFDRVRLLPETDIEALSKGEFNVGHPVLALFPTTTCLYRATIVSVPSKRKKSFEYLVQFENDDIDGIIPARPVPARYILDTIY